MSTVNINNVRITYEKTESGIFFLVEVSPLGDADFPKDFIKTALLMEVDKVLDLALG